MVPARPCCWCRAVAERYRLSPLEKISVISSTAGLSTVDSVEAVHLSLDLMTAPRVIFMVHGYNSPEDNTSTAFSHFRRLLGAALSYRHPTVIGHLCGFYWPGHHPNEWASAATFPARITDAKESGKLLANVIRRLSPQQDVVIVAHSLGCRVALHAVRQIRRWGQEYVGPKVTHVFLLAAAVPAELCVTGNELYGLKLDPAPQEHVFHSHNDMALRPVPFGAGTWLAENLSSPAVGVAGEPFERWIPNSHPMTLQHGQYWSSYAVAKEVVRTVGFAPSGRLATRSLAASPPIRVRVAGAERVPQTHDLGQRHR